MSKPKTHSKILFVRRKRSINFWIPVGLLTVFVVVNLVLTARATDQIVWAKKNLAKTPLVSYLVLYQKAVEAEDTQTAQNLEQHIALMLPQATPEEKFKFDTIKHLTTDRVKITQELEMINVELTAKPDLLALWLEKAQKQWLLGDMAGVTETLHRVKELDPLHPAVEALMDN